jgi:predicted RNA-binding Zn-ribbon protein involved in translation (DUF1610 family)
MSELNRPSGDTEFFFQSGYVNGWCAKCGSWKTLREEANDYQCSSPNCGLVKFPDGDSPWAASG